MMDIDADERGEPFGEHKAGAPADKGERGGTRRSSKGQQYLHFEDTDQANNDQLKSLYELLIHRIRASALDGEVLS